MEKVHHRMRNEKLGNVTKIGDPKGQLTNVLAHENLQGVKVTPTGNKVKGTFRDRGI